jgi:hypothetical protein
VLRVVKFEFEILVLKKLQFSIPKNIFFSFLMNCLLKIDFLLLGILQIREEKGKNSHIIKDVRAGVGNSLGFEGLIRDKLGIRRPVQVNVN